MKKTLLVIGLALAGVINNANAQSSTNDLGSQLIGVAQIKGNIGVTAAQLQSTFFVIRSINVAGPNNAVQSRIVTAGVKTNAVPNIPATIAVLTGGYKTVSGSAPLDFQVSELQSAIGYNTGYVSATDTNQLATLTANLARLQAGLAAATNSAH